MKRVLKGLLHLSIVFALVFFGSGIAAASEVTESSLPSAKTDNVFSTQNPHTPYRPFEKQTNASSFNNQTINLSNDMVGTRTPFQLQTDAAAQTTSLQNHFSLGDDIDLSLQTQYSHTYGWSLVAKYAALLNPINALAADLELGNNQYRGNLTWAYHFLPNHQVKFSAEDLAQKIHFNFDSGAVDQWIHQPAVGFTYAYLIHRLVEDINLNAFYSKAQSKTLSTQIFSQADGQYENYRHIAGATDQSLSLGTDLLPSKKTQVGLQLNYDSVRYNMRYETNPSESGLGQTVTLDQILSKRFKLELLESSRKPYDTYKASLNWLMFNVPGSNLELGLTGARLLGNTGTPSDSQFGLDFSYHWDVPQLGSPSAYTDFEDASTLNNIKDWASTPAVYQAQVLAVRDQKTIKIGNPDAAAQTALQASNEAMIEVNAGEAIDIPVDNYLPETWKQKNVALTASHLPHNLVFEDNDIKTKTNHYFTEADAGKTFTIDIVPQTQSSDFHMNMQQPVRIILTVTGEPYANPSYTPPSVTIPYQTPIRLTFQGSGDERSDGLFKDPLFRFYTLALKAEITGPLASQLTWSYQKEDSSTKDDNGVLTISGNAQSYGNTTVTIYARNKHNPPDQWATQTQQFTITVLPPASPIITPQNKTYTRFAHETVDNRKIIADLTVPNGSIDCSSIHVGIGTDHLSKAGKKLSDYGLSQNVICTSGTKQAQVYLTGAVTNPTLQQEDYPITAKNADYTADPGTTVDWYMDIKGAPVVNPAKKALDSQSTVYFQSEIIAPVPNLMDHFNNPTESGSIDTAQFQVVDEFGSDAKTKYGIYVDSHGTLVGTLLPDAKIGAHLFFVRAKNGVGYSRTPVTQPSGNDSAIYYVTIKKRE